MSCYVYISLWLSSHVIEWLNNNPFSPIHAWFMRRHWSCLSCLSPRLPSEFFEDGGAKRSDVFGSERYLWKDWIIFKSRSHQSLHSMHFQSAWQFEKVGILKAWIAFYNLLWISLYFYHDIQINQVTSFILSILCTVGVVFLEISPCRSTLL